MRKGWRIILLAGALLPAAVLTRPGSTQTPPSNPSMINVEVFHDDFSSSTYATYSPLGGASLLVAPGQLTVQVPPGDLNAGFQMSLPPGGTGVRCVLFDGFKIPDSADGTSIDWTWIGNDDVTGMPFVVLDTTIVVSSMPVPGPTKQAAASSFTIRHRKANGTLVVTTVPNKRFSDVRSYRWDTRQNGTQVMLEITFNDNTTYNSTWLDPSASTISGFQVVGSVPTYSLSSVDGLEYHVDTYEPGPVPVMKFDSAALNALSTYFLGQTDDSDVVAVARVARVGRLLPPVGDDPRPRLRVVYTLEEALRGRPPAERFAVLHAIDQAGDAGRFQPGKRFILYLRHGLAAGGQQAGWYFDYGHPTGVVPFSRQNLDAVMSRIAAFYRKGAAV